MFYDLESSYYWVFLESWGFILRNIVIRNVKVSGFGGDLIVS